MNTPLLSIVVVSFNTKEMTDKMLNSVYFSLREHNFSSFEVIVVDNASTDSSVEMLKEWKKREKNFLLIENKKNIGFGRANNLAVKKTRGKYLLFLNSDILVLDNAILKLLEFYRKREGEIGFVGGKLLNPDKTPQPSAGPFYTLPVIFGALFLRGDYWGLTRYSPTSVKEVDWISGACILTTKRIFEDVEGFDKNIFMYMEEIDLFYRAKKKGYSVWFYPDARFIHYGSLSSKKKSYPILQVFKGFLYFYKKHNSQMELMLLKSMLKLKAIVGLLIGRLLNNRYLIDAYGKALKTVE